jgi:hypothetical protein
MTLDAPSAPAESGSTAVEADIAITHTRTEGTLLDAGYRLPNNAVTPSLATA